MDFENQLAYIRPDLAKEWHPIKNGDLTPEKVGKGYNKKVWWLCPDKHEWQTTVVNRITKNTNCPYCSGRKSCSDNNLQVSNPNLALEWNIDKNAKLTPMDVTSTMVKKVWWLCVKRHEWEASIRDRSSGTGCPYCKNRKVSKDNCLSTTNPDISLEWNFQKNGNLSPHDVTYGSRKNVWWICKENHAWKTTISNRTNGTSCPYCAGKKVDKNNSLSNLNAQLAKEWHPSKNEDLTSNDVTIGSSRKVWWLCEKGHEWETTIKLRSRTNCPHCNNFYGTSFPEQVIYFYIGKIFKDAINRYKINTSNNLELDIYIPSIRLAIEYDGYWYHLDKTIKDDNKNKILQKNGYDLIRVRENSNGKKLPQLSKSSYIHINYDYDYNENTSGLQNVITQIFNYIMKNKKLTKEELVLIKELEINIKKDKYEILSKFKKSKTEKSLFFINPKISEEWNYIKNKPLTPKDVTANSNMKVWWICKENHEYEITPYDRNRGRGCPYCSGRKVSKYNSLSSLSPEVAKHWDFEKNKNLTPNDVTQNSGIKVWWRCMKGHKWEKRIIDQVRLKKQCAMCYKENIVINNSTE